MGFQEIVIEIDDSNHQDFLASDFAVIHFFSDRHMNCLMTLPVVEDVAREFSEHDIMFGKVNIDENQELARKHRITFVPSVIFLRSGDLVDKLEQIQEDILREKIAALLQAC
jgi:thioredoxin 1